jgi:hypothetical protein
MDGWMDKHQPQQPAQVTSADPLGPLSLSTYSHAPTPVYIIGTGFNNAGLWLFFRSQLRDQSLIDRARAIAREKGFDTDVLMDVQHEGCTYAPGSSRGLLRA